MCVKSFSFFLPFIHSVAMGGIISRERWQHAPRKPVPQPEDTNVMPPEAPHSTSQSKAEVTKVDSRTLPSRKHSPEHIQELTEEMIEGLTLSSSSSTANKTRKKDVLENWLLRANYPVTPENDALERHRQSMEALRALPHTKKERSFRRRSSKSRSLSHSKGSRTRQPPTVEVYHDGPTTAQQQC